MPSSPTAARILTADSAAPASSDASAASAASVVATTIGMEERNKVLGRGPWAAKTFSEEEALSQEEWQLSLDHLALDGLLRNEPIGQELRERGWLPWRPNEARLKLPPRTRSINENKDEEKTRGAFAHGKNWESPQDLFCLACELSAFNFWDSLEEHFPLTFVREDIATVRAAWIQTLTWGSPQALGHLMAKTQTAPQLGERHTPAGQKMHANAWGRFFLRVDSVQAGAVLLGESSNPSLVKDVLGQMQIAWRVPKWRSEHWDLIPAPLQKQWVELMGAALDEHDAWSRPGTIMLTQMSIHSRGKSGDWLAQQLLRIERSGADDLRWMESNGRESTAKKMKAELAKVLEGRDPRNAKLSAQDVEWGLVTRRFGDKGGRSRWSGVGGSLWDWGVDTDTPALIELSERLCGPMPLRIQESVQEGSSPDARSRAASTGEAPSQASGTSSESSVPNPYHLLAMRDLARQKSGKYDVMGRGFDNARAAIEKHVVFDAPLRQQLLAALDLTSLPALDTIPKGQEPDQERVWVRTSVESPFTLEALLWRGNLTLRPRLMQWLEQQAEQDPQAAAQRWAQAQTFAQFPPVQNTFKNPQQSENKLLALSEAIQLRGLKAELQDKARKKEKDQSLIAQEGNEPQDALAAREANTGNAGGSPKPHRRRAL